MLSTLDLSILRNDMDITFHHNILNKDNFIKNNIYDEINKSIKI
jgi:hypothetical protein